MYSAPGVIAQPCPHALLRPTCLYSAPCSKPGPHHLCWVVPDTSSLFRRTLPKLKADSRLAWGVCIDFFLFLFFLLSCERVFHDMLPLRPACSTERRISLKPHCWESGSLRAGWAGVNLMATSCSTTSQCYKRRKDLTSSPMEMSDMATLSQE